MIELNVSLASNGAAKLAGYEQMLRFGYTKNRGVYRLAVTASGEWEGLAVRCFWHVPDGKDPLSSLVVGGYVDVPASVTAQPGSGCITFEGSDGTKTVTSADLRYRVAANSGTEDGTEPEPGTPAWQQLVDAVHADATAAEQAKTDAQTAAQQAGASAKEAEQALSDTITAKEDALKAIGDKQTTATQAVDTARDKALKQVEASTKAAQTAATNAATSAGSASQSAAKSSAAASNANVSAENAARAQVTASQLAGQAADSASEAQNSATKAAASQQAAESNAAAAQGSATKADASASTAVQGQQRAEAAATRAETAQQQTESASTDALDKISSAKTDALKALDTKQTSATTAVESAKGKALDAVTDAQDTATQAVQAEQASATTAVKKAGAEVLTSIPEDYQTTVQKVKELDAQKVETDEAISAVKARQNVLTGTETGNPIAVDDAFAAPLCGLNVYGKSTQDGTPTPDAPVPIVSAGDGGSVAVKVTGRNLFYEQGFQEYFINSAADSVGLAVGNVSSVLQVVTGAKYYVTRNKIGTKFRVAVVDALPTKGSVVRPSSGINADSKQQVEISATSKYMVIQCEDEAAFSELMVSLDSSTTYSPYREQLLTLPTPNGLPGIPVTSGGNYTDPQGQQWICDEVDLERGVKVQRVYKVDVDGENAKFVQADNYANLSPRGLPIALYANGQRTYGISTFTSLSWFYNTVNGQFLYLIAANLADQLNASCKKQLGKIYYALATPIETPLTPDEIAAYKALTAYGPDTVVQAGDGAGVKLVYQRDVNIAIKKLEDAVASMT